MSLGGGGLFTPESLKKRHHPLPHVAAAAAAVALGDPLRPRPACLVVMGREGREGDGVHGIGPFHLGGVRAPRLAPGRRSLSHQTLLILDLRRTRSPGNPSELALVPTFGRWTHHAGGLDGFRQVSSVGLTPEDVTLELLGAAVHDHSEGVAVVADAQKGEEAYLALPDRLLPLLSGAVRRETQSEMLTRGLARPEGASVSLPVPSTATGRYR